MSSSSRELDFLTLICTCVDILSHMYRQLHHSLFTIPPWPPNQAEFLYFTSRIDEAEITRGHPLQGKLASLLVHDPQVRCSSFNSSLFSVQLQHFHRVQLKQSRDLKRSHIMQNGLCLLTILRASKPVGELSGIEKYPSFTLFLCRTTKRTLTGHGIRRLVMGRLSHCQNH